MSEAGFQSMRITPKGRDQFVQIMEEHILSLSEEEFEAIHQGREPARKFSAADIAVALTCYAATQLESRPQSFLKAKLTEILAKTYEP